MANKSKTEHAKDPIGKGGSGERDQVASTEFPTDLHNLSEADKKKWFRVEKVCGGREILKVRTELLNLPDVVGEPGFLEKTCNYELPLKQDQKLVFDKDF
jgi:hypothetical protein